MYLVSEKWKSISLFSIIIGSTIGYYVYHSFNYLNYARIMMIYITSSIIFASNISCLHYYIHNNDNIMKKLYYLIIVECMLFYSGFTFIDLYNHVLYVNIIYWVFNVNVIMYLILSCYRYKPLSISELWSMLK